MTKLQKARTGAGHWITQKQVADAAGISPRTYQDYEQGKKDINKAAAWTVYRIACALTGLTGRHYTVEDLLEKDG